MRALMGQERVDAALARSEAALERLEAAAAGRPAAGERPLTDSEGLARLKQAHSTLRGRVEGAIAQIDALLAAEGSR